MIGPHEGKELELMLLGEKPMAIFHDYVPDSGEIEEYIVPEKAFAPYVMQGRFVRFEREFLSLKNGSLIRYVCFTQPSETWRAEFFLWLKSEFYSAHIKHDVSHDILVGKLLGYSDEDISDFTG